MRVQGSHKAIGVQCYACARKGFWDIKRRVVVHSWNQRTGHPSVWCEVIDDVDMTTKQRIWDEVME